jgi:hypothetical protein
MYLSRATIEAWIARAAGRAGVCDECDTIPHIPGDNVSAWIAAGWEFMDDRAGLVARCPACRLARPNAWALRLDPDRVAEYLATIAEDRTLDILELRHLANDDKTNHD